MGSGSCASALAAESPSLDPPTAGSMTTMVMVVTVVVAVLVAVVVILRVNVVKRAAMRRRQAGGNYHVFAERCFAFSPTVLDS